MTASGVMRAGVLAITTAIALLPSFASGTVVMNVEHVDVEPVSVERVD